MATPNSEALEAARTNPERTLRTGQGSALKAILVNTSLGGAKLMAGIFGHSYALIADACESFGDVIGSSITFYALKKAAEPPDKEHPVGHGRAETLAAMATSIALACVGALIFWQAAETLHQPRRSPNPLTLCVLVPVILAKEWMFHWMRSRGRKIGSQAIIADAWHQRSDVVTSIAALSGIIIAWAGGPGWAHADSWAAMVASVWLAGTGFWLLSPVLHELMEGAVDPALLKFISETSAECEGIKGVEKVWVRKLGMRLIVDLHIEVDPDITVQESHRLAHQVKDKLQTELPQVRDVMVHVEPYEPGRRKRSYRRPTEATR
jgi:cation diffusion facilitator family transporter